MICIKVFNKKTMKTMMLFTMLNAIHCQNKLEPLKDIKKIFQKNLSTSDLRVNHIYLFSGVFHQNVTCHGSITFNLLIKFY